LDYLTSVEVLVAYLDGWLLGIMLAVLMMSAPLRLAGGAPTAAVAVDLSPELFDSLCGSHTTSIAE
jgi:hypothetical protein